MSKHTPGPWAVKYTKANNNLRVVTTNDYQAGICTVHALIHQDANAHLIAASPRMYDYIKHKAEHGFSSAQEIIDDIARATPSESDDG